MKIIPKKSLGQNFLVNPGIIDKIIRAGEISQEDTIVEVGPGTGNLTRTLVETGARIIAIEKDIRLVEDLEAEFSAVQVEIVEADVLKLKTETLTGNWELKNGNYKIIANLPYYITSHFLRQVLSEWPTPKLLVLMVQKEVARRIVSKPPDMNLLALSVQYYADVEIISYVSKGSFRPEPKVDSAIIKLVPHQKYHLATEKEELFFRILKTAFAGKRKQLATTLPHILPKYSKQELSEILQQVGIDPQARPETVDMTHWIMFIERL